MSDLVKRLRDYDRTTAAHDMVEAADRIEALEAQVELRDAVLHKTLKRIEVLEAALRTILANTEEDAIPHIAYDGLTAYQALAKDIADCARAYLAPEQDK
jgi:hypothetical protein